MKNKPRALHHMESIKKNKPQVVQSKKNYKRKDKYKNKYEGE